jgi:glucosamine-phosphate N-acetyltransferase
MQQVRNLIVSDYSDYLNLISQLTTVGDVSKENFRKFVLSQNSHHKTLIWEIDSKAVACLTILVEQKIAHSFSKVMHIEDVVVDEMHRGKKLSRKLVEHAIEIGHQMGCYKIILNCSNDNIPFYEHLGFKKAENQMVWRY